MQIIDTHCHLDFPQLSSNLAKTLADCATHGVKKLVVPAVGKQNWQQVKQLGIKLPNVYPAFGMHPVFEHQNADLSLLEDYLRLPSCIAIGEFGLDFAHSKTCQQQQLELFNAQLELAASYDLPVILHVYKAHDVAIQALRHRQLNKAGIVHAFSGSEQQARQYIELGYKLGFGGTITYSRAKKKHRLLQNLPLSAIVLETDAPDMPPCFVKKGEPNTPANAYFILQAMAKLLQLPTADLAQKLNHNAKHILAIN